MSGMKRVNTKYRSRNGRSAQERANWMYGKKCQLCKHREATEVHHIAGRNAKARDDIYARYECQENWLASCRRCHVMVDKETPAYWACAAKMLEGELDLRHLQDLKPGKKFAILMSEIQQASDDLVEWRKLPKQPS
tara:strand:+ start:2274 stop:2681 length:408 start_codon:yes stop_codon:yes gene_type:complete